MVQHRAILKWLSNRKSYMIYRMSPFSTILNDRYSRFQDHGIFWRWISQRWYKITTQCQRNTNRHLHMSYTEQCRLEWPWVTSSDLAKYSMTWSIAWPLCDTRVRVIVRQHTDARYWYRNSVRLSVCLSVSPSRSRILWKQLIVMVSWPPGSPINLVLWVSNTLAIFRGSPSAGALNTGGV